MKLPGKCPHSTKTGGTTYAADTCQDCLRDKVAKLEHQVKIERGWRPVTEKMKKDRLAQPLDPRVQTNLDLPLFSASYVVVTRSSFARMSHGPAGSRLTTECYPIDRMQSRSQPR